MSHVSVCVFRCTKCNGSGKKQCETCKGKRQLLTYIELKVEWWVQVQQQFQCSYISYDSCMKIGFFKCVLGVIWKIQMVLEEVAEVYKDTYIWTQFNSFKQFKFVSKALEANFMLHVLDTCRVN